MDEWSSYEAAVKLFRAAAVVTDEPDIGRRVGEETLRQYHGTEVAALLRSLGSPGEVIRNVAITSSLEPSASDRTRRPSRWTTCGPARASSARWSRRRTSP